MSDFYFKKYYDDVCDPSWPTINNYTEFLKLPPQIVKECIDNLGLKDRLTQLENHNYWLSHGGHNEAYINNDIAYVPTYKCAHMHYVSIFHQQLGWEKVKLFDIDITQVRMFGLMINPYVRRLKGLTQTLVMSYQYQYEDLFNDLKSPMLRDFISSITLTDIHTMPYTVTYGNYFTHINWIPMDLFSDADLKSEIEKFVNVSLPDIPRINQSTDDQNKVFKMLEENFMKSDVPAELGLLFADDIKFYNRLIETYERM